MLKNQHNLSVYFDAGFVEAYQKLILSEVECLVKDGFSLTTNIPSHAQGRVRHRPASSAGNQLVAAEQIVEDLSLFEPSTAGSSQQADAQEEREEHDPEPSTTGTA